jgi:hypothetical protein
MPHTPFLQPYEYCWEGRSLLRIPVFWEDDQEWERPLPCWHLPSLLAIDPGLKVFNFHPIHIYLNTSQRKSYQSFKQAIPEFHEASAEQAPVYVQQGEGTQTLFVEVIQYLAQTQTSVCIRDLYTRWQRRLL